ncbi:hypothetical protein BS17DRAFT_789353 [Gyrodon lividus]|nr:hypothetical protein BS17DRAFT_789353 [Gyrodon lividus]
MMHPGMLLVYEGNIATLASHFIEYALHIVHGLCLCVTIAAGCCTAVLARTYARVGDDAINKY